MKVDIEYGVKNVGLVGLEPTASCTPCMRATNCAIARISERKEKRVFIFRMLSGYILLDIVRSFDSVATIYYHMSKPFSIGLYYVIVM